MNNIRQIQIHTESAEYARTTKPDNITKSSS